MKNLIIMSYEAFNGGEYVLRQNHFRSMDVKYNHIVDLIKDALGDNVVDIRSISKSTTDFGKSWYIIFENGKEIRISDHSIMSNSRIMDSKYISFVNASLDFDENSAKEIVSLYLDNKKYHQERVDTRNKAFDEMTKERAKIDLETKSFINQLKEDGMRIYNNERTYHNMETFLNKHPKSKYIFQKPLPGGAFKYVWVNNVNNINSINNYYIEPEYYYFLKENDIL